MAVVVMGGEGDARALEGKGRQGGEREAPTCSGGRENKRGCIGERGARSFPDRHSLFFSRRHARPAATRPRQLHPPTPHPSITLVTFARTPPQTSPTLTPSAHPALAGLKVRIGGEADEQRAHGDGRDRPPRAGLRKCQPPTHARTRTPHHPRSHLGWVWCQCVGRWRQGRARRPHVRHTCGHCRATLPRVPRGQCARRAVPPMLQAGSSEPADCFGGRAGRGGQGWRRRLVSEDLVEKGKGSFFFFDTTGARGRAGP